MIALIQGKAIEKFLNSVVVLASGVGYEIQVTSDDYERTEINAEIKFYTFHSVRENSEDLYGFSTLMAKKLFELLITVQGIGPKAALAILSLGDAESVRSAIAAEDLTFVSQAQGIGKKTAEKLIVSLRDKVGAPTYIPSRNPEKDAINFSGDEALDALIALGFTLSDATIALSDVPRDLSTSERVKLALKQK